MANVKVDIGNGNVFTSLVSKESVEELDLKLGDFAYILCKSTEVMVGKD